MEFRIRPLAAANQEVAPILFPEITLPAGADATVQKIGVLTAPAKANMKVAIILEIAGTRAPVLVKLSFEDLQMLAATCNMAQLQLP